MHLLKLLKGRIDNLHKIKEAIVVEGKYDKIKLSSIYDTLIICTNGFSIFSNDAQQELLRNIAKKKGLIIFTDSDRAGFLIRHFICGIIDPKYVKHAYAPQIEGKEKRKATVSKDGFLGVEGIGTQDIIRSISNAATSLASDKPGRQVTKADLFIVGLCGREDSKMLRDKLLKSMDLPIGITANPLIHILNSLYTYDEAIALIHQACAD